MNITDTLSTCLYASCSCIANYSNVCCAVLSRLTKKYMWLKACWQLKQKTIRRRITGDVGLVTLTKVYTNSDATIRVRTDVVGLGGSARWNIRLRSDICPSKSQITFPLTTWSKYIYLGKSLPSKDNNQYSNWIKVKQILEKNMTQLNNILQSSNDKPLLSANKFEQHYY